MSRISHRLDGGDYVAALERDGRAFADALADDLDVAVPGCPGWSLRDLASHLADVHYFWGTIAAERLQDREQVQDPARPTDVTEWYRASLARLVETLRSTDPATSVWTWSPEKNVAWIRRRMAHETAVHRWDAQSAVGTPQPIPPPLAVDGVDEFFEFFLAPDEADDTTVHLHATDTDAEWLVTVTGGRVQVEHRHAKGDVAVRGGVSDLLLLLWGRIPEAEVEVVGERAALFRLLQAADLD